METSVDQDQATYSHMNPMFDMNLSRSELYSFHSDDLKAQKPRRQWCLNVIIVYLILLTGLNVFLFYKVFTLEPHASASSTAKQTGTSNHILPIGGDGEDVVDLPAMVRNNSEETMTLRGHLGALQNQVSDLCGEGGQISRLRADLSLVNTSTFVLDGKLTTITLTPGPPGPPGTNGDKGLSGIPGVAGQKGDNGDGKEGPAGPPGPKGDSGEIGPQGAAGEQGQPGPAGQRGDPGPQGPDGALGPHGIPGPPGPAGDQGPGAKGEKGDTGIPGVQGPPGRDGSIGEKGDQGFPALQGVPGAPGPKGDNGTAGPPGIEGPAGPSGPPGVKGDSGLPGPPGVPGPKGGGPEVRLAGGTSSRGRVELKHNGAWGTVCDDSFDTLDGTVICKMLGFQRATATFTATAGQGEILLDDLRCKGTEADVFDCPHSGIKTTDCSHQEDAGVQCA